MGRSVALAAAALVSIGVFTWLAGPLLETQFGTEALVAAYAALAGAAGAMTYVLIRARDRRFAESASEADPETVEATIELDETGIDEEIEQIKNG
jgi:Flp pilus assembly protein TadB